MVYDSEPCCTTRVEHHHYYHKAKPKKHKVHRVHKRVHRPCYRPTYKVEVFYPTYACEGGPCSPCSNCYPVWERVQCFEGHAGRVYTSQPSYYRDYGPPTFSYGPFYPYGYSQDQRTGDDTGAELQVNY
jgi:hypothetical protein